MGIVIKTTGSFDHVEAWLHRLSRLELDKVLNKYGTIGQNALSNATPAETGLAGSSWGFHTKSGPGYYSIVWTNSDIENGFPVVVMLVYGHGTGTGGYVQGRDFVMPAILPIFEEIAAQAWEEVTRI
jgi:hypothetical protein